MAYDSEQSLKVLIAEDSAPDRLILESIVAQSGHKPIAVSDGVQAIEAFKRERPDIVLLDVIMPNLGGLDTARAIRSISEGELVPIVFLTSLSDSESLVECLEAGGDDFASKPYNRVVLQSKIKAFSRMREMHRTLAEHKNEIERHNSHLIREQQVAKQVFDKIAHTGCLDMSNIRYYLSPLAVFNGDVLVSEISPNGSMLLLLGDFTGHGLPAAIGSMPLASTFYGMARKGFSVSDILREINSKLHQILPVGFFCCATCVDINFTKKRLRIWNGGLPDCFLYRKESKSYERISSNNLPLGVLPNKSFKADTMRIELNDGDRLYMWSDGILEARNKDGEMFGEERLFNLMNRRIGHNTLFDEILGQVHSHIGTSEKDDDLSIVEITVDDVELVGHADYIQSQKQGRLVDWSMTFEVEESSLKEFDPLPLLVNIMCEVPGLKQQSALLYTVLSELYTNALEHGVLGLPSVVKATPKGFAEYYKLRKQKLEELEHGKVTFSISHAADEKGGLLKIRIVDSGDGFGIESEIDVHKQNEEKKEEKPHEEHKYFGRGLSLISSICETLTIYPPGNEIETCFRWNYED